MKNTIGVEKTHEIIYIAHIVTDVDGSLKIKKVEEFFDSKAYLEFMQSVGSAMAASQATK
jgi:hypothetical protein